jgi:hypothetical protein
MFPPAVEDTDHVIPCVVATLFRIAANCNPPPAGTVPVSGLTDSPVPMPTVATAVFEVIRFVFVVEPGTCGVVAVMFTWPLFEVGTTAGAV